MGSYLYAYAERKFGDQWLPARGDPAHTRIVFYFD